MLFSGNKKNSSDLWVPKILQLFWKSARSKKSQEYVAYGGNMFDMYGRRDACLYFPTVEH